MHKAVQLCASWAQALQPGPAEGRIHSVFDRAVNIEVAGRMVCLLPAQRCLYPWSCTVESARPFPLEGLKPGMRAELSCSAVGVPEARYWVDLAGAHVRALTLWPGEQSHGAARTPANLPALREILSERAERDGLCSLALGTDDSLCAAKVRPLLGALDDAFLTLDAHAAARAAAALAGCGPGLTPSSDDMLVGYVSAFFALCRRAGRDRGAVCAVAKAACEAAAGKTNLISGSFLRQCGDGLACEDILHMLDAVFSDAPAWRLRACAARVLDLGATSGADILTGMVLSLQKHAQGEGIG